MGRINMQSHQRGFTLIELLLYMGIVGILLTGVSVFFGIAADARVKNQTIMEVNDQATYALDYITQTIRNASSITSPVAASSGTQLTLVVPTASLSPTVFSLSGTTLQVKEGTATAISLTSDDVQVTALSVKNLTRSGTTGNVQVSITLNRTNPSGSNLYDYSRTFTTTAEVAQ